MIIDFVLFYVQGRGGVEDVVTLLSNELVKRGHRVRIWEAYSPYYIHWANTLPEIHYYGESIPYTPDNFSITPYIEAYTLKLQSVGAPDIAIATQQPFINYLCYSALHKNLKLNTPIISWIHGQPAFYGWTDMLKYGTAHLAISKDIAKKLEPYIAQGTITFIGNPIETAYREPIPHPKSPTLELLYIGRLDPEKRVDLLLNSLASLKGDWHLKIIGDGGESAHLHQQASDLNINSYITWTGWKDKPWEEVTEASLLILTSDYEGMPLVLLEALSRGIPVISTMCGGPQTVIRPNENGWLIPINDAESLTTLLTKLLNQELSLPSYKDCQDSVKSYDKVCVCNCLEKVLYGEYVKTELIKLFDAYLTLSKL